MQTIYIYIFHVYHLGALLSIFFSLNVTKWIQFDLIQSFLNIACTTRCYQPVMLAAGEVPHFADDI